MVLIPSQAHYWASPEKFIPERFLEDYNKDAFIPFSAGKLLYLICFHDPPCSFYPSRCSIMPRKKVSASPTFILGAIIHTAEGLISKLLRFAETQIVAALTTLVQNYKVTVKEEPQFAHETLEQREKRILRTNAGLTTTYAHFIPLNLWDYGIHHFHRPVRIPLVFTKRD